MARLSIHLLDHFHVTLGDRSVTDFESAKVRALLAYLALEAGRVHSRDTLAGLLWCDQPERTARRNLSQALFNLRQVVDDEKATPPFFQITPASIQFNLNSDHWLDASEFAAHMAAVKTHAHAKIETCESCLQHLAQADQLYCGEFLTGFFVDDCLGFCEWATLRRERFHLQVLEARTHMANFYERRRDFERASYYARRQVELEPWREEAHLQLMRLLVYQGQRSAALHQYETCRRILADELNIEPSSDTRRLYRRIQSVSKIGAHNLPPQPTPFVGRAAELRQVADRLSSPDCRLLTLVGQGGIGKTRLAIQAAYENRNFFLHGVCFVSLAALQSSDFLVSAIADSLQLALSPANPKEQLLTVLRERDLVLVLDNFEHLIEGGTNLLVEILQAAPEVKLLVTSRERLHVYGETNFDVEGLEVPAETDRRHARTFSAVDLFMQSANRVRVGFTPTEKEWTDVARICRLVEGMPLGIELAASWVRAVSCHDIATEIEQNLVFLQTSVRGLAARHQSMQATFDYSWNRLSSEEQQVFVKSSVFRGGFDAVTAFQVIGASHAVIANLVDKSFLKETNGRYHLHELMRQYAAEKLGQDPRQANAAHDAHCEYYADYVYRQFEWFKRGQRNKASDAIEAELDNIRAAWLWAIQCRREHIEKMMGALYEFCLNRRHKEGEWLFSQVVRGLEQATQQDGSDEATRQLLGKLLWRYAEFYRYEFAQDDKAEALFQSSLAILQSGVDKLETAQALRAWGNFLKDVGRKIESRQAHEASVELCRMTNDRYALAQSLLALSSSQSRLGEMGQAKKSAEESRAICQQDHNEGGLADTLKMLGSLAFVSGDYAEAKRMYLASETAYEQLGELAWANVAHSNAGHACMELGEYETAAPYLREALKKSISPNLTRFSLNVMHGIAELCEKQGDYASALKLATFVVHEPMAFSTAAEPAQSMLASLENKLPSDLVATIKASVMMWTLDDAFTEAFSILEKILSEQKLK